MEIRIDLIEELHRLACASAEVFKATATALVGEDYEEKNCALSAVQKYFTDLQKEYAEDIWKAEDEAAANNARVAEAASMADRRRVIINALQQGADMRPDQMNLLSEQVLEKIQEHPQADEARFYWRRSVEERAEQLLDSWARQAGLGGKVGKTRSDIGLDALPF